MHLIGPSKSEPLRVSALRAFSLTLYGAEAAAGEWYLESSDVPADTVDPGATIPEASWNEIPDSRIGVLEPAPWPITWNVGNAYYRWVRVCLASGSFTGVTAVFTSNDRP